MSDFRHQANSYAIVSFYEVLTISPLSTVVSCRVLFSSNLGNAKATCMHTSQIVNEGSATMNLAHEEIIPVSANHINICKFESPNDPTFELVYMRINRILRKHVSVVLPNTSRHQPDAAIPHIDHSS